MAALSGEAILDNLKEGNIKIEPFDETALGPASIDFTLGNEIRVFKNKLYQSKSNPLQIIETLLI
eukprot:gnl/Chilomastix_caulleri/1879.p1 GENE.gnl/Chilomastix_caulleri/1879~~gnl/Chilomastix_caulleri/1879.p1  ORF type:complete len:65 (+),score=4.84 gnl/Chilomastix_caulleri/1879:119-313(+)